MDNRQRRNQHNFWLLFLVLPIMGYVIVRLLFAILAG